MADHDPLCPLQASPGPCGWCRRIAKIRADERAARLGTVRKQLADLCDCSSCRETLDDVRDIIDRITEQRG